MSDHVCNDFGLAEIAAHFGKSDALETYFEGSQKESDGDVAGAIVLYRRAYRLWPGNIDDNVLNISLIIIFIDFQLWILRWLVEFQVVCEMKQWPIISRVRV